MKDPITGWLHNCLDELEMDSTPLEKRYINERMQYILADVEAKRRQLTRHRPMEVSMPGNTTLVCMNCIALDVGCERHTHAVWPCPDVRDMASPFQQQIGYRPEWIPEQDDTTRKAKAQSDDPY